MSQIIPLCASEPCYASNTFFAERLGITETTVSTSLKSLDDKGYIQTILDRKQGNKRTIQVFFHDDTLYKIFKDPSLKSLNTLFKNLKDPLKNSYKPYLKNLNTLFKNLNFIYKEESKEESKVKNKEDVVLDKPKEIPKPEQQQQKGFDLAGKEREEFNEQVKAGEKLNVEQTKEYLTNNETAWMEFRKDTKVLEFDIFKKLINEFGNVVIGKEGELYPITKGKSLSHFKYFIINRFKENPSLFKLTPTPPPPKKKVSEMTPEEFKAFKIAENLEQERDFANNAREREESAKKAEAKKQREEAYLLNKKTPTVYPWMQAL